MYNYMYLCIHVLDTTVYTCKCVLSTIKIKILALYVCTCAFICV